MQALSVISSSTSAAGAEYEDIDCGKQEEREQGQWMSRSRLVVALAVISLVVVAGLCVVGLTSSFDSRSSATQQQQQQLMEASQDFHAPPEGECALFDKCVVDCQKAFGLTREGCLNPCQYNICPHVDTPSPSAAPSMQQVQIHFDMKVDEDFHIPAPGTCDPFDRCVVNCGIIFPSLTKAKCETSCAVNGNGCPHTHPATTTTTTIPPNY